VKALLNASVGMSDADLLGRVATGDLEALGALFDRYEHAVRRFLARLGTSESDLDDLVQLTFLEVVRAARRFEHGRAAKPWLLGVAATIVRRHRRSFARMAARVRGLASMWDGERPETPAEAFEGREVERKLARALGRLSQKKREVFVMVTLEGASGEDVAAALGVPVNTVWTRLHHARTELRRELSEEVP